MILREIYSQLSLQTSLLSADELTPVTTRHDDVMTSLKTATQDGSMTLCRVLQSKVRGSIVQKGLNRLQISEKNEYSSFQGCITISKVMSQLKHQEVSYLDHFDLNTPSHKLTYPYTDLFTNQPSTYFVHF